MLVRIARDGASGRGGYLLEPRFTGRSRRMNDLQNVLLTVGFVAAVTVVITLYARRKMAQSWGGAVERVRTFQRPDPNVDRSFVHKVAVTFRTDQGRRVKIELERSRYDAMFPSGLVAGDRVEKTPGAWFPARVG